MIELTDFEPRIYQQTIFATAAQKNTLVVLPTGLGKTAIALMLAVQRLNNFPDSKILFLAPTKPLCGQHLKTFRKHIRLDESQFALFTGEVAPEKRAELWKNARIVFSTPQGLENDLLGNRINLEKVSLLVLDECHRAVGDYAYSWIARHYTKTASWPRILGLTASPGSELDKIQEVCKNLFIEAVEIRTDSDPDVMPYVQEMDIDFVKVELPESFKEVQQVLKKCLKSKIEELKKYGLAKKMFGESKKELLAMQAELIGRMTSGDRDFFVLKSISLLAEAIKVQHALELLESQGITALQAYFERLAEESRTTKAKAIKNLVADENFKTAVFRTQQLFEQKIEHPKLAELKKIIETEVQKNKTCKIIVFTQFRDSAVKIKKELAGIQNVAPEVFVGQAKKGDTGLSQKQQMELIEQFKDGLWNVLICTSVAEEGLDIPSVDLVVFYEPIPSAIRYIQRKGRTGRQEKGRVVILVAKNTRDEGYRWSAHNKEKRMKKFLKNLGKKTVLPEQKQPTLQKYSENKLKIFADYREKSSGVLKELVEQGAELKLEMLETADYLLSPRVGVEFKTAEDFASSIIDGRLLEQAKALKQNFERPVVIVQGEQDIYTARNIHPNAIRGMLATIAVSYGIPIIQTKNAKETAAMLLAIARREQEKEEEKAFTPHALNKPMTLKEQQEYLVSCLPSVGPSLAKELLRQFKTIKNIINSDEEKLVQVKGIGEKIAKGIKELANAEYEENKP